MRSKLGSHIAGAGTDMAFVETEEPYQDHKVSVRLPSDFVEDKASLSGPVIKYNLYTNGGDPDARKH